jgi:magnesium chelatase subunit D
MGATRGEARNDARVNVIETLRAAAPWQLLRRGELLSSAAHGSHRARIDVRTEDLRVTRYVERTKTTTIFVVDASGSSALHRLAEVKGAVQMLLAQCYIRRDQVAVLSFRGRGAELLLPPTRALARAKRSLEGLAGGGQTPLASALDATIDLVEAIKRRGDSPVVVMLTDGRANMPRSGTGGREAARNDALHAARLLRTTGVPAMLVDSSAQASSEAARLASEMGAQYLPLPYADSSALAMAVQSVNR